jgi:hypothetical protein
MDAPGRLTAILQQRRLRGFPPYGAQYPMVCLSEFPLDHLHWLITQRGFPPWGVVLHRQWVYAMGGAPVWYARPEQYARLDDEQRRWANRLETTAGARSDWLHERGWRIPLDTGGEPSLPLPREALMAVLVGYPNWQVMPVPSPTGMPEMQPVARRWPPWSDLEHWWLNPRRHHLDRRLTPDPKATSSRRTPNAHKRVDLRRPVG